MTSAGYRTAFANPYDVPGRGPGGVAGARTALALALLSGAAVAPSTAAADPGPVFGTGDATVDFGSLDLSAGERLFSSAVDLGLDATTLPGSNASSVGGGAEVPTIGVTLDNVGGVRANPVQAPTAAALRTPEGARALGQLFDSRYTATSEPERAQALVDVAGQLRDITASVPPLTPDGATGLYPLVEAPSPEVQGWADRYNATQQSRQQDALAAPSGLQNVETQCALVCRADGTVDVVPVLAVGDQNWSNAGPVIQELTPEALSCATRVQFVHTHPCVDGALPGLSTEDLSVSEEKWEYLRERGPAGLEIGDASVDLGTGTIVNNLIGADGTCTVQVMTCGTVPVGESIVLGDRVVPVASDEIEEPLPRDPDEAGTRQDTASAQPPGVVQAPDPDRDVDGLDGSTPPVAQPGAGDVPTAPPPPDGDAPTGTEPPSAPPVPDPTGPPPLSTIDPELEEALRAGGVVGLFPGAVVGEGDWPPTGGEPVASSDAGPTLEVVEDGGALRAEVTVASSDGDPREEDLSVVELGRGEVLSAPVNADGVAPGAGAGNTYGVVEAGSTPLAPNPDPSAVGREGFVEAVQQLGDFDTDAGGALQNLVNEGVKAVVETPVFTSEQDVDGDGRDEVVQTTLSGEQEVFQRGEQPEGTPLPSDVLDPLLNVVPVPGSEESGGGEVELVP